MDYVKYQMEAGKDMVEAWMTVESAQRIIATAENKKVYREKNKWFCKVDGFIFRIKKPGGSDKDVSILQ